MTNGFKFGVGSKQYTFPHVTAIDDNFGNAVLHTTRLPGLSGGLDDYGILRAPTEIGSVNLQFNINVDWAKTTYSDSNAESAMQKARDAVMKLASYGKTKLYKPAGSGERWCMARIQNINMPLNQEQEQRDTWTPVGIAFQVSLPFWFIQGKEGKAWGEFNWGDGTKWGGDAVAQACSGVSTTWTETTVGNAETLPRITVKANAGGCDQPRVQRLVEGYPVDELVYNANLVSGDILEFDCRGKRVILNGIKSGFSTFDHVSPDWFTLEPGANSIRLIMLNSGNAADVTLRYYEAYR